MSLKNNQTDIPESQSWGKWWWITWVGRKKVLFSMDGKVFHLYYAGEYNYVFAQLQKYKLHRDHMGNYSREKVVDDTSERKQLHFLQTHQYDLKWIIFWNTKNTNQKSWTELQEVPGPFPFLTTGPDILVSLLTWRFENYYTAADAQVPQAVGQCYLRPMWGEAKEEEEDVCNPFTWWV